MLGVHCVVDILNYLPMSSPLIEKSMPSLITFAFRSSDVRRLLLNLGLYSSTGPFDMFPPFFKRTADVMAPRLKPIQTREAQTQNFAFLPPTLCGTDANSSRCSIGCKYQGILLAHSCRHHLSSFQQSCGEVSVRWMTQQYTKIIDYCWEN